jgi:hypothetical protein
VSEDSLQEIDVGHNPMDHKLLQRGLHPLDGRRTILGMDDQLRQQGIVEMRHLTACRETRIDADAGSARLDKLQESAGAG